MVQMATWQQRLNAVMAAMLTAFVVRAVAIHVAGVHFASTGKGQLGHDALDVGVRPVLLVSGVACLLGWLVLEILERAHIPKPSLIWTVGSLIVFVLATIPLFPWNMAGDTRFALVLMHVLVTAVYLVLMRPTIRQDAPSQ